MTKSIYVITNDVNDMVYVGQSVDVKHRWQQHISESRNKNPRNLIDEAIKIIGKKHFKVDVIEKDICDFDEKEKYWIHKFNSLCPNGYNKVAEIDGLNNEGAKLNEETLNQLIEDIAYGDKSFNNLAKKYNISPAVVSAVNLGTSYFNKEYKYPLRQKGYSEELFKQLVYSLKYELDKSMADIAREYKIDLSTLSEINQGKEKRKDWLTYPIRSGKISFKGCKVVDDIIQDLKNNKMMQKEIARKYNVSTTLVSQINLGTSYKKENEKYPIRETGEILDKLRLSPLEADELENVLKNTELSMRDIAEKYGVCTNTIMNFNNGTIKRYHKENQRYPLRHK